LTDNSLVYPFMMFPYGVMLGLGLRSGRSTLRTETTKSYVNSDREPGSSLPAASLA
jgi:hypothetical protein